MKLEKTSIRKQKEYISLCFLSAKKWKIEEETKLFFKIINKETGEVKLLNKFRK